MADIQSIFLPRRGKKSTMNGTKKTQVLAKGELFIEAPDTGVGTGHARAKVGDGATQYGSLPYAWGDTENDKIAFTSNTSTTVAAALNSVVSGNTLATLIAGLKQAIVKSDARVTELNDETIKGIKDNVDEIINMKDKGELGMTKEQANQLKSLYDALQNGTLGGGNVEGSWDGFSISLEAVNPNSSNTMLWGASTYYHSSGGYGLILIPKFFLDKYNIITTVAGTKRFAAIYCKIGLPAGVGTKYCSWPIPRAANEYNCYLWGPLNTVDFLTEADFNKYGVTKQQY